MPGLMVVVKGYDSAEPRFLLEDNEFIVINVALSRSCSKSAASSLHLPFVVH